MWPLIIMAAAAAAQAYQSSQAQGANKAQLDKMRADFAKLVPPGYDVSITDPPAQIQKAVPPPNYDQRPMTPEQYQVVGKYSPEAAQYIAEKNPELVKQSAAGDAGKNAQLDALRSMRGIATSDFDPQFAQQMSQASRQAQTDAQSRSQSVLTDMARRGAGNSGLSALLQQNAGADAMDREAGIGMNAASQAYKNKIDAIRQSGAMGSDIAQQDQSLQGRNADIINSYNQRMTKSNQDWQTQRAQMMNDAQRQNLTAAQGAANNNVDVNNKFAMENRQRQDMIANSVNKNQLSERDYQNALAEKRAQWKQGQKEYGNSLAGKTFDDRMRITQGQNGLATQGMQMNTQNAQDRNQMIQGAGQAGMGYMQSQKDDARWNKQQDNENARWKMKYQPDEEE